MKLRIDIEPTAKGRPRMVSICGHVHTYTPKKTADMESAIRYEFQSWLNSNGNKPFPPLVPLRLTATFFRCKSMWLPARETMPYRKPDLDNFVKLLIDALNGIAFQDDAQITTMIIKKRWTPETLQMSRKSRQKGKAVASPGYIAIDITEDYND